MVYVNLALVTQGKNNRRDERQMRKDCAFLELKKKPIYKNGKQPNYS